MPDFRPYLELVASYLPHGVVPFVGVPNDCTTVVEEFVVYAWDCIPYSSSSVAMAHLDAWASSCQTVYCPLVASYDEVVDIQNPSSDLHFHCSSDDSCTSDH